MPIARGLPRIAARDGFRRRRAIPSQRQGLSHTAQAAAGKGRGLKNPSNLGLRKAIPDKGVSWGLQTAVLGGIQGCMEVTVELTEEATSGPTDRKPNPNEFKEGAGNPASMPNRLIRKAALEAAQREVEELRLRLAAMEEAQGERDADWGVVTASRMRKVMGQREEADCGPTEKRLREWLVKDVKGFMAAADAREKEERGDAERDRELAELREKVRVFEQRDRAASGRSDEGMERVDEVLGRILGC